MKRARNTHAPNLFVALLLLLVIPSHSFVTTTRSASRNAATSQSQPQSQPQPQPQPQQLSFPTSLFGFKRATAADKYKTKQPPKQQQPRRQREPSMKKLSVSNDLMTNHQHRLATAGKIGTLRYADPTKIFLGNLNFTATEAQLQELILPYVATPWDIAKITVVRDWKTGDSKGYAFCSFTEPVFATICLQELQGKQFLGRPLKVKPAQSKSDSPLRRAQRQEQARLKALRRAQNPPPPPPPPKPEDPAFLAFLDPDLAVGLEAVGEDGEEFEDGSDDDYDGWEVPGAAPPKGFG